MQMHALLLAILLAGGNPVWDQQSNPGQAQICSERATATVRAPATASPAPNGRRLPACPPGAKPLAEATGPAIQTR